MHTQGIRKNLRNMDQDVHSIIARAAIDELLYKAGSGLHDLNNSEVIGIIAGCIEAYHNIFEEQTEVA